MFGLFRGGHCKRIALSAAIALSFLFSLLAFVQPASAAPATITPVTASSGNSSTRMSVTHFDPAVASAHGYHIVTVNGVQSSVKNGSPEPENRLGGNCGASYIYMYGGTLVYSFNTGFDSLRLPAVWYGWEVNIAGPYGYERTWTSGGAMFGTSWSANNVRGYVDDSGYYNAQVVPGGSWVILVDGSYCTSLGPQSTTYVS